MRKDVRFSVESASEAQPAFRLDGLVAMLMDQSSEPDSDDDDFEDSDDFEDDEDE